MKDFASWDKLVKLTDLIMKVEMCNIGSLKPMLRHYMIHGGPNVLGDKDNAEIDRQIKLYTGYYKKIRKKK